MTSLRVSFGTPLISDAVLVVSFPPDLSSSSRLESSSHRNMHAIFCLFFMSCLRAVSVVFHAPHHSVAEHCQWDAIQERSFRLILVSDCGSFASSSQEILFTWSLLAPIVRKSYPVERKPVYRVFYRVQKIFIPIPRRFHSSVFIKFFYSSQTLTDSFPTTLPGTYILLLS